jgi:hypothetical protein
MKRFLFPALIACAFLFAGPAPARAGVHVTFGFGLPVYYGPYAYGPDPYWYGGPYYYPYGGYYSGYYYRPYWRHRHYYRGYGYRPYYYGHRYWRGGHQHWHH